MQFAPLSQPASAADLPTGSLKDTPYVVVPSWQGLYFGGHAGGVWGNTGVNDRFDYIGDPGWNGSMNSAGFTGGAQAGYNFQRGHFVFGPEADIGYLGISVSKSKNNNDISSCTAYYGPNKTSPETYDNTGNSGRQKLCWINGNYSSSSDLYGDLTARFGYTTDRTLLYVKGGAALLDADFKASYQGQNCVTIGSPDCANASHKGTSNFNYDHSAFACRLDRRSGCRIRYKPLLVSEGGIPALRLWERCHTRITAVSLWVLGGILIRLPGKVIIIITRPPLQRQDGRFDHRRRCEGGHQLPSRQRRRMK